MTIIRHLTYATTVLVILMGVNLLASRGLDSVTELEQKVQEADGVKKTELLNRLVSYYVNSQPAKALEIANQALENSLKENDEKGKAESYLSLGEAYYGTGENIKALNSFFKAIKIFEQINDEKGIAASSDKIGLAYRFLGEYDRSLEFHLKALEIYERLKDDKGIISSLINAGIIFRNIGQDDKALINYNKALKLSESVGDYAGMLKAYVAIGNIYWYKGENDKALSYYEHAYEITQMENFNSDNGAGILNNIGNVYRNKKEYNKALGYYSRSLAISKKAGDKNMISVTLKNIGLTNLNQGRYNQAIKFLNESKDLAEQIHLVKIIKEDLKNLSLAYQKKKDFENALKYETEYSRLKDEIFNEATSNKIATLQMEYEMRDKEQQQVIVKKEKELDVSQSQNVRNFFIFAFIIIMLLVVFIWYRYRLKSKANLELKQLNSELEKRVQERTKRLNQENEQRKIAQEQAELANETKNRFLANISHEVRTPINAIIGFCDLTIKTVTDPEHKTNLKRIKDSSEHLLSLIKDILDYSQIESGKLELKNESFDLDNLVTSVINAFYLDANSKKIKLTYTIEDDVPKNLKGDSDVLRQVLYNLVGNAIKFTDDGTVQAVVKLKEPKDNENKVRLLFSVKDTGVGITKLKQKLIFNDFTQADSSSVRRFGGAGLGLTISKRFVEMMNGRIWVESEKGKGSDFKFEIEITAEDENVPVNIVDETVEKEALHILVAEDNLLNAQVISAFLKRLGHTAKTVDNGKKAVDILASEKFDAILMDIEMPEMDGLEATKAIRSGKVDILDSKIPIFALTAHALKDYEDKCYEVGMDGYLTKPIDIDKLSKTLSAL